MIAHDLVLSSGFLAFGRHCGVLDAIEDGIAAGTFAVDGICGTSSGAMVGALWAAGWPARRIADELSSQPPLRWMAFSGTPWRGLFSMKRVVAHLDRLLPPRIEDLPRPFGVGVVRPDGTAGLLTSGPLAPAVAASCAMPVVFTPVAIDGAPHHDGGALDRLGLTAWRAQRGVRPTVVHLVRRSAGPESGPLPEDVTVVHSERSGATFFSLGDLHGQAEESRLSAVETIGSLDVPSIASSG